jgi:hypothetical protein
VLRAAREQASATSAELAVVSGVERNTLSVLLARKTGELETRALSTGRSGTLDDTCPTEPVDAGRPAGEHVAESGDEAAPPRATT